MAVVSVKQRRSRTWGGNDKLEEKGKRTFWVLCDSVEDGPEVAAAAVGISYGDSFSTLLPRLVVVSIDANEIDPPKTGVLYEVVIDYSTKPTDPAETEEAEDPCDRPAQVRINSEDFEETVYKQVESAPTGIDSEGSAVELGAWVWGNAICSSAGTPMPISETYADPVITWTKNVRADDFGSIWRLLVSYGRAVNTDSFTLNYRNQTLRINAGEAYLSSYSSEHGYENGVQFENVSVTLKVREDGWKRLVQDQGLVAYDADPTLDGKPKPVPDANGEPVTEPVPLNGRGAKLGSGQKPVFLSFTTKKQKAFGPLFKRLSQ